MQKGEQLDSALKRMDEIANLVDIDLSQFSESQDNKSEEAMNTKDDENITLVPENDSDEEE